MTEAFIWRKSAIWLGVETTRGTAVAPVVRLPKTAGVLNPTTESATDDSWYWVIDEIYDSFTTKNKSGMNYEGMMKNDSIWYILKLTLWDYKKLKVFKGTVSGGTPARGDSVSGGTLRKILKIGSTTYYCFDGSVSAWTITNGTWTLSATEETSFTCHFFSRLNSNTHPSATIYDVDPVASSYAPFCMVNTFEMNCEVGDYVKISTEFQGKQMQAIESGSEPTPAYSDEPAFTASMSGIRFANNESGLNTADEMCMQSFRLSINKNLTDIQCIGWTDVAEIYNQQFWVEGDCEALFEDTTLRDYALNSQKKAVRFYAENNTNDDFSAIYIDMFKVGFNDRTKTDSNNEIVKQTMWFTWQYSNDDGATIEIVLLNWNTSWY